jgi:glycolate oxidase
VTGDAAERARTAEAFSEIIDQALAFGGTVTGEHGVGLLKRRGLVAELSPAVLEMHRAVKRALDPYQILNPGKIFEL